MVDMLLEKDLADRENLFWLFRVIVRGARRIRQPDFDVISAWATSSRGWVFSTARYECVDTISISCQLMLFFQWSVDPEGGYELQGCEMHDGVMNCTALYQTPMDVFGDDNVRFLDSCSVIKFPFWKWGIAFDIYFDTYTEL